jgi:Uma2 family endonuclease
MTVSLPKPIYPGPMTVDEYEAFLETRPEEERWQLIEGVAVLMTPPTYVHQRIGFNLATLLNSALSSQGLGLFAYVEGGVRAPGVANFQPTADVVVVPDDPDYLSYDLRFRFVAEILSPTNRRREIDLKATRYRAVESNLCLLVIDSRKLLVEMQSRVDGWVLRKLTKLEDEIVVPEFGFRCTLLDLYRRTPLDPERQTSKR